MLEEDDWNKKLEFSERGVPWCWLTWALRENGLVELRAVSLTSFHAEYARKSLKEEQRVGCYNDNPLVRTWSEKRWTEHIYGLNGLGTTASDEVIQEAHDNSSEFKTSQFKEFMANQYSVMRGKLLAAQEKIKELEQQIKDDSRG